MVAGYRHDFRHSLQKFMGPAGKESGKIGSQTFLHQALVLFIGQLIQVITDKFDGF